MEKTFKIKWDDSLGEEWMNIDNLRLCLFTKAHIGGDAVGKVEVLDETNKRNEV